ncbi:MAG: hypothetical protein IKV03_00805 [Alphaproteobacteria bacterium]|nr:hypothetical protein [Alphaproteobacteria bacterium]
MDFISVIVAFLGEFLMGFLGAKWAVSIAKKLGDGEKIDFSFLLGVVILLTSFVCVSLVFGSNLDGGNPFFFYAVLAMGLVVMVLSDMKWPPLHYALGLTGICLISSYFLPVTVGSGFEGFLMHIGLSGIWVVLTWLFVQMDRIPFMSMTLSLVFAIFYFLLSNVFHIFDAVFGYLVITLVVVQMGINTYLKKGYFPGLEKIAATFVAFVFAGMAVYAVANGFTSGVIILYSYIIMEVVLSIIASIAIYQRFVPVYPFIIEQALFLKEKAGQAFKFVMYWYFLIACLGVLSVLDRGLPVASFFIAVIFFLIHIYMRLKSWGESPVKLRDLWKDAKMGLQQLKAEVGKISETKKQKTQMEAVEISSIDQKNEKVVAPQENKSKCKTKVSLTKDKKPSKISRKAPRKVKGSK